MFDMEDVKATFAVYCEQEGYMAYLGFAEMVAWLAALHVESSTELLAPIHKCTTTYCATPTFVTQTVATGRL